MQTKMVALAPQIEHPTPQSMGEPRQVNPIQLKPAPGCSTCEELRRENTVLRSESGYWKAMHHKALDREQVLRKKIERLKAKLSLRERQLFDRRSERRSKKRDEPDVQGPPLPPDEPEVQGPPLPPEEPRRRGQQRGSKGHGHGRRLQENLPVEEDFCELAPQEQACPRCGLPAEPESGTEDSEVVEVEVRAYRRRYRRRRYRLTCQCPDQAPEVSRIITAPPPPKLIPKGAFAVSFWVFILEGKFLYQFPLYRILTELRQDYGLDLSQGTVTDGLQRLSPLFKPLYEAIVERNVSEDRWHADETRWLVFGEPEVKPNPRWYLWVFRSPTTVVYRAEPTRSAEVPKDHFGKDAEGILSVDRYAAYKVLLNDREFRIILAFCWAHVRRDFLAVAKDWPKQEQWGFDWVNRIGKLYRLNRARLAVLAGPDADPGAAEQAQAKLSEAVGQMLRDRDEQLADLNLHGACRKALESLQRHWEGLTIFLDHPEVPMDNSEAERKLRGPVVGRKNYYGSGSLWSAVLTVMLFSLFQTLLIWNFNVRLWLSAYLGACAQAGGRVPPNPESWLPWNMDEETRRKFERPERPAPVGKNTS